MKLVTGKLFIAQCIVFLSIFISLDALAFQRTVCFELKFADVRDFCPQNGAAGVRRGCNDPGGLNAAVGHYVALYDKDTDSADDFIGVYYIKNSGNSCISFEWENSWISQGEPDPDLYITYINAARSTNPSHYFWTQAKNTDGTYFGNTSWRNGTPANPDLFVASNCPWWRTCYIYQGGSLVPTTDTTSLRALAVMAIDSLQHTFQAFGGAIKKNVLMHYPAKAACATSCSVSQTELHIATDRAAWGSNPTHEMGHNIQKQQFGQDSLRDNCSLSEPWHDLETIEYDSCATTEGWANYIAVASWYDPDNVATVPWMWGYNIDEATPLFTDSCAQNSHTELQLAKTFWDFDDADINGLEASVYPGFNYDQSNSPSVEIARAWSWFPDGTGNRQDFENDPNGVNIWDFFFNNMSNPNLLGYWGTALQHNCVFDQNM